MRISTGLLIVALAILIAVGGLVLVQRLYSTELRKQHNDGAGFIYAVLGVAYAVLLGLMLIAVWENGTRPRPSLLMKPTNWPGSSGTPTLSPNPRDATSRSSSAPTIRWW
jgi:TRAP-type C4-dicarboxylate transport system permease small subunit